MSEVRNPFGLRDGKFITIADITPEERGRKCGCVCPSCNAHFTARLGQKNRPHFAHDGEPCDIVKATLKAMYLAFEEGIAEHGTFTYPDCWAESYYTPSHMPQLEDVVRRTRMSSSTFGDADKIISKGKFSIGKAEVECDTRGIPEAMILTEAKSQHQLAVVIVPPPTVCKISAAKAYKGLPTLAVEFPESVEMEKLTASELKKELCQGLKYKAWVSSPEIETWQKGLLEIYQATYKRQQEERAKREAELQERRREAQERQAQALRLRLMQQAQRPQPEKQPQEAPKRSTEMTCRMLLNRYPGYTSIPTDELVVRDGQRYCFCKVCRTWYPDNEMAIYGGNGREMNAGICRNCNRRPPSSQS